MTTLLRNPYRSLAASVVDAIDVATLTRKGTRRASGSLGAAIRAAIGDANPIGDGDVKTGAPGTYRPVGATCPPTCSYLASGCYAQGGNVVLHQRAATSEVLPAIRAAIGAFSWGALTSRPVRLHVSGDLGRSWDEARPYVVGLIAAIEAVRARFGPVVGWTYTHLPRTPEGKELVDRLAGSGIHVRWSDHAGIDGAIVAPFDVVPQLRARTGLRLAKCPAQLTATTCRDCGLCWERPDLTIVFDPHGGGAKRLAARVRASIGGAP